MERQRTRRPIAQAVRVWTLVWVLLAAPAAAQESEPAAPEVAPTAAEAPAPAEPAGIPVPLITGRAEEVAERLRAIESDLEPTPALQEVESELPGRVERIEQRAERTRSGLDASPTLEGFYELEVGWSPLAEDLETWQGIVERRSAQLQSHLDTLAELRDTWDRTRAEARAADAPAVLLSRVDATRRAIASTRARVVQRRDAVLALQNRVSQQQARIDDVRARIGQARAASLAHLLHRDQPPLWRPAVMSDARRDVAEGLAAELRGHGATLREYVPRRLDRLTLHAVLFAVLLGLLRAARQRAVALAREQPRLSPMRVVFDFPGAMALLLAMLGGVGLYPEAPRVVAVLFLTAALLPAIRILRHVAAPPLLPLLNAALAFFAADRVRDLTEALPVAQRLVFALELLAATGLLAWLLRPARIAQIPETVAGSRVWRNAGAAMRVALVGFAIAFAAEVAGFHSLARLIGNGLLAAGYTAVVLYAGARVLHGLVVFACAVWPLSLLRMVRRNRARLERLASRGLVWAGYAAWILVVLQVFALREPLLGTLGAALEAELAVGAVRLALMDVLVFGLTIWAAFMLSRVLRFVLEEDVYPRVTLARGAPYAVSTLLHYALIALGFLFAVAAAGLSLDRFTIVLGALGVGVGLGLQDIVRNFVAGLILLFERPVQIGDAVQVGETWGEVVRIGIRASVVRTWDGAEVILPNGDLVAKDVINWTLSDAHRRLHINVGVTYGTDPDRVLEILRGVAAEHPSVMNDPAPLALFEGFGDSSLDFSLRVWIDRFDIGLTTSSELRIAVRNALAAAGIQVPFPQRDLHLRSVTPDAGVALRGTPPPGADATE